MKNKWTPAPKLSKNSNDNNEYKLKIHLGKTNYKKDNITLRVYLTVDENKTFKREVKLKKEGDFDEEILWTLNSNEWNNIDNHIFILDYWTGNMEENGAIKLNISSIKSGQDLLFEWPIDLNSENIPIKVDINIHPIIPEEKKNLDPDKKDEINVKKIYQAFNGKSMDTFEIPNYLTNN